MSLLLFFLMSPFLVISIQAHASTELDIADFCQMVKTPEAYDGKTIAFPVIYATSEEGSIVFGEHCKKSNPEEDIIAQSTFSATYKHDSPLDKKLERVLRKRGRAKITLLAKFIDGKTRVFGHMNCCRYKVEIQQILDVQEPQKSD